MNGSLADALRDIVDNINEKRTKKLSHQDIAREAGLSYNTFKKWINTYRSSNMKTIHIRSLIIYFLSEGGFRQGKEEEEIRNFWTIANTNIEPQENWIKNKLQELQNKRTMLPEKEELEEKTNLPIDPIDILTQYLPELARLPVKNFLDTNLVGTKNEPALFGGRKESLAFLNDWLNNPQSHLPYTLLYAPTGRGKSTLLARWAAQLVSKQKNLAVIFLPISLHYSTNYEAFFLRTLAGCLMSLYGDTNTESFIYKNTLDELRACIAKKLRTPLPDKQQLIIILDGVDEAKDWEFNAASLFPNKPIPNLRIIVSTRTYVDETESQDWLSRIGWYPGLAQEMELDLFSEEDIVDLLAQEKLPLTQPSTGKPTANILYKLSVGEPLLVNLYVKELLDPHRRFSIDQIHLFNPGLDHFFDRLWREQRKQWGTQVSEYEPMVQAILTVLAHVSGPLDLESLLFLLPSETKTGPVKEALYALRRIVIGDGSLSNGYVFSHSKLREYERSNQRRSESEQRAMRNHILERGHMVVTQLQEGTWTPEQAPSYIVQFYRKHLTDEITDDNKLLELLLPLLSEGWKRAWDIKGGLHDGFFDDVQAVWDKVHGENTRLVTHGEKTLYITIEIHCALCLTSRNSLAENASPKLLAACVERDILSLEKASTYAKQISDEFQQAKALVALAQHSPPGIEKNRRLREVLMMAQHTKDARLRSQILLELAPNLSYPSPLYFAALETAQKTDTNGLRTEAIVKIAIQQSEEQKKNILRDIVHEKRYFHTSNGDSFKSGYIQAIAALVPLLNDVQQQKTMQKEAWEIALGIGQDSLRIPALIALAAHLPADFVETAITQVQTRRCAMGDWRTLASIVSALPLPPSKKDDIVQELLHTVPKIEHVAERAQIVRALLPSTTPSQRQHITTTLKETLDDARYKAEILTDLARLYPHENWLGEARKTTQAIQNPEHKTLILCDLLPLLQQRDAIIVEEDIQRSIDNIKNTNKKSELLLILSCNTGDEKRKRQLVEEAWGITYAIKDEHAQAQFLAKLAVDLPPMTKMSVLDKAQALAAKSSNNGLRLKAMQAIIPSLPEAAQDEAIQNLLETIENLEDQAKIDEIEKLAPHLKPQHYEKVIKMAEEAKTRQNQAHLYAVLLPLLDEPRKSAFARKVLSIIGTLGNKEKDQKYQADMFDLLAPHLPNTLLRDAKNIAQAIRKDRYKARALTALVPRLPEMDLITEILKIMPTINFETYDQRLPPHIFLTLAPYYQTESLIDKAFKWAEDIPKVHRPQVFLKLLPHLIDKKDLKVEDKLEEAVKLACELEKQYRAPALTQLAPHLINFLKIDRLYRIWSEILQLLATQKRDYLLEIEAYLYPVILQLTCSEDRNNISNVVITVGQWWQ